MTNICRKNTAFFEFRIKFLDIVVHIISKIFPALAQVCDLCLLEKTWHVGCFDN